MAVEQSTDPSSSDDVVIHIATLDELFTAGVYNPWLDRGSGVAGIDRILDAVRSAARRHRVRLTIAVPAEQLLPDAQVRVAAALSRWCDVQLADSDRGLAVLRRKDRSAFVTGSLFLVACFALAATFDSISGLPDPVRLLLTEGLIIAGWVGMWKPLDILLYDRADARRERRVLAAVREMSVTVRASDPADRPAA